MSLRQQQLVLLRNIIDAEPIEATATLSPRERAAQFVASIVSDLENGVRTHALWRKSPITAVYDILLNMYPYALPYEDADYRDMAVALMRERFNTNDKIRVQRELQMAFVDITRDLDVYSAPAVLFDVGDVVVADDDVSKKPRAAQGTKSLRKRVAKEKKS